MTIATSSLGGAAVAALLIAAAFSGALGIVDADPSVDSEGHRLPTTTAETANATLATNQNDEIVLRNGPRQTISGQADLPPGTNLTIHVRSSADNTDLNETLDVSVREGGTFEVTTDAFAGALSGIRITAWVTRNGTRISQRYDGVMRPYDPGTITFTDQRVAADGGTVVVDSVMLSDGGFVTVRRGSANGSVIGVSEFRAPGLHENVSVELDEPIDGTETLVAVLHWDTNDNEAWDFPEHDGPITLGGSPLSASATVTVSTPSATPSASPTPTSVTTAPTVQTDTDPEPDGSMSTASPSRSTEASGAGEGTRPSTTGAGPGFGTVVAVLAVLAAGLVAADRRE